MKKPFQHYLWEKFIYVFKSVTLYSIKCSGFTLTVGTVSISSGLEMDTQIEKVSSTVVFAGSSVCFIEGLCNNHGIYT